MSEVRTAISSDPLDAADALAAVADPSCGGIAAFVGTVRATASTDARAKSPVVRLDYEAHPTLAEQRLRAVVDEAVAKWDLKKVVAIHRTGPCELGEPTVVIACSSPHRADALEACRWVIDTVKATVPIWKREVFADGSAWVEPHGA